jgi:K+-transporting ATPase ATPase A chain
MWLLPLLIIGLGAALALPLGVYLAWLMDGRYRPPDWLRRVERCLDTGPQSWKQYVGALLLFSTLTFVLNVSFLMLQPLVPPNPDGRGRLAACTIFHTAASFVTNTGLQHYAGEQHLSHFSQLTAILWNMFVSAGVGFCSLTAVIRGLRGDAHLGNFYLDLWRIVVYVLLPGSLLLGVPMLAAGVPMTFEGITTVAALEAASDNGTAAGQEIARGPVAALIAIKHLGNNGSGFYGANSAHPFENPGPWANIASCATILLLPFASLVMFGRMLNNARHALVLGGVMALLLAGLISWAIYWDTLQPNPALAGLPVDQELGNLEGKELRFGTSAGATFAAVTTTATCGSVNCAHDSLNPLAGLVPLAGMWLNCVFGSKGVGLINLLLYLIVGVFLTGLMVGRTPEYLGKKVEAQEMKLAMLALLVHPILVLGPTGLFAATAWGTKATSNPGPHGFSQILYEFSSASANNGSGFEGLHDTWGLADNPSPDPCSPYWDVATALVMLLSRYLPIVLPIALTAGLAAKKPTPFTVGSLRTDTVTFACVLLGTILILGPLLFLPSAVLGPVAEHLGPMPFGR